MASQPQLHQLIQTLSLLTTECARQLPTSEHHSIKLVSQVNLKEDLKKSWIPFIQDQMVHLIRNAIAHGGFNSQHLSIHLLIESQEDAIVFRLANPKAQWKRKEDLGTLSGMKLGLEAVFCDLEKHSFDYDFDFEENESHFVFRIPKVYEFYEKLSFICLYSGENVTFPPEQLSDFEFSGQSYIIKLKNIETPFKTEYLRTEISQQEVPFYSQTSISKNTSTKKLA